MYRVDNDIRALLLGGFGHIRIPAVAEELQVRTVRLIDYEDFAVPVDGLRNRLYVGAYAVVVRRRQYDGFGIGIFGEKPLHFTRGNLTRNAVFLHHLGVGVDRLDSAEDKRIVDGFVAVSCHNQFFALRHRSRYRRNHAAAGAVYEEIRLPCAV